MKRENGFYWVKERSADAECGWEWVVAEWNDGYWRPIFDEYERTDECWIEIDERRIVRDEPNVRLNAFPYDVPGLWKDELDIIKCQTSAYHQIGTLSDLIAVADTLEDSMVYNFCMEFGGRPDYFASGWAIKQEKSKREQDPHPEHQMD